MGKAKANGIVAQGGGGTAVINRSLSGLVDALNNPDLKFEGTLFGALHASEGMRDWNVQPLNDIDPNMWRMIRRTPAPYLGSTRDRPDGEYCERILENFRKNDIRYLFYIGGNDSADTANIIHRIAKDKNYELMAFHIHKTVDNDLVRGHHMPGFPSAAKHLIYTVADLICDAVALPGILVVESMGRHAGYLTAAAVLVNEALSGARVNSLVFVPEVPVDLNDIVEQALESYEKQGIAVVVYSEGIKDKNGIEYKKSLEKTSAEKDPRGQIRMSASPVLIDELQRRIKQAKKKMRVIPHMLGYPQRADPRSVSEVDKHEAYQLGRYAAVQALVVGVSSGSFGIEAQDEPYQAKYAQFPLEDVAQKSRTLDPKFILPSGQINEKEYRGYLRHMLGSLNNKNELNPRLLKAQ